MNTDFNIKNYNNFTERENLQELFDKSFIKNDLKGELKTLKTILDIISGNHRSEISSIKSTL
jgi:hypothetical protein